jgi:ribosomal-protein-alanine N-acetyltransferase
MSVFVKPVERSDAAELIQANIDNRSYHEPWARPFINKEGFEAWFGEIATSANIGLVAREHGSRSLIGVVNLNQIVLRGFRSAYLGYYGFTAFAGRGFMTEAVRTAARYAFDEIGLNRLEVNIQPGNARSVALIRRIGFRKEGYSPRYLRIDGMWCDHERWALLSDEMST